MVSGNAGQGKPTLYRIQPLQLSRKIRSHPGDSFPGGRSDKSERRLAYSGTCSGNGWVKWTPTKTATPFALRANSAKSAAAICAAAPLHDGVMDGMGFMFAKGALVRRTLANGAID